MLSAQYTMDRWLAKCRMDKYMSSLALQDLLARPRARSIRIEERMDAATTAMIEHDMDATSSAAFAELEVTQLHELAQAVVGHHAPVGEWALSSVFNASHGSSGYLRRLPCLNESQATKRLTFAGA